MNYTIKHLFIINPKSFVKKTKQNYIVAKIHQFFKEMEDSEYDIYVSRFPRDAVGFIPLFAKNLPETTTLRVYAVGGDGILFDCLNGIMGLLNAELAAMPFGQTNNFIRGFDKNDRALFRMMSQQYNAPAIPMDVMRCGNNYALNYCVVGIEAEAANRAGKMREQMEHSHLINQWLCRHLYIPFFFLGALAACLDKHLLHQRYQVTVDRECFSGNFAGFSIFNGSFYNGYLHPITAAMPNDGILNMLTIKCQGAFNIIFLTPFYLSGHHKLFPRNFVAKQGRKISISSESTLQIAMDGIVFFESGLDIELLPAAIRFVDAGKHGYKGARS